MLDNVYQILFIAGFFVISFFALKTAGRVSKGTDFALAGRSLGYADVSWVIIGTLVGGASTIGTVQMAFHYGFAAWIFTLGSGIACLLLGLFFAKPLHDARVTTVSEYLGQLFGRPFQYYASALISAGMFVHVVGQFLAAIAILQSVFSFSAVAAILITFMLLTVFIVRGGIKSAGFIGKCKIYMLYIIMVISAALCLVNGGGLQRIFMDLPAQGDFFSVFAYGTAAGSLDMISMLVGVLSTQIYLQAIFSARTVNDARKGAFLSAALIPPLGILAIIIGLYLRVHHPELDGNTAQALPFFLNNYFPAPVAALFSAGLLLIVLGTASGLVLGVATNLQVDFAGKLTRLHTIVSELAQIRLCSLAVLLTALLLVYSGLHSTILSWSYLSMGLRGAAVFAGLCMGVFFRKCCSLPAVRPVLYIIPVIYLLCMI